MHIHVVTQTDGQVIGVFTKLRKALACAKNAEREWGGTYLTTSCEVNEDGTQEPSGAESSEGQERPEQTGATDEASQS